MTLKNTGLLALATALIISSCRKEEVEINLPEIPQTVLEFDHKWGDQSFALGQTLEIDGMTVKFDEIRYYMSNFVAVNDAMETEALEGVFLVEAGNTDKVTLSKPSIDHLHKLEYVLGLDIETNHSDPTTAAAPLNDATMHWGWNQDAGYKMMKIEGQIDTNGDGVFEGLTFHCATDAVMREAELEIHENAAGKHSGFDLHLEVDYKAFFSGIDFTSVDGQTHGASLITNKIMDNATAAITLK